MKTLKKIKVDDIVEAPFNYNEHPANQLEEIKNSLQKFGQYKNVVLWKDNQCIAGNGLVMAAKELGLETLSCYVASDLSEVEAKQLCLTDNAAPHLAKPDSDKLQELLDSLPSIDDIPAVNNEWLASQGIDLDLDSLASDEVEAPTDFKEYDDDIETEYRCPKCNYEWSGKAK